MICLCEHKNQSVDLNCSIGTNPVFRSELVFSGKCYMGDTGKNKREAEQLAAQAVLKSILSQQPSPKISSRKERESQYIAETDSGVMVETIRSKLKLPIQVDKRKEVEVFENVEQNTDTGLKAYMAEPSDVQSLNQLHVFKKLKSGSSSVEVAPPKVSVPLNLDPSLVCSSSAKKQNWENKEKVQQNVQVDPPCGSMMGYPISDPMLSLEDVSEELNHKNRLEEFTQESSLDLPAYQTFKEGVLFKSSIHVDGVWYTSPNAFINRKAAEQDAAKFALSGAKEKTKHKACQLIHEAC